MIQTSPTLCLKPLPFARALHISPRLGLAYVNNPKVACSTIKLTLQRAELDNPAYEPAKSVHQHEGSPLLTWPTLEGYGAAKALEGRFVFSFVRNPYARLRSAYLNKILTGQKGGHPREMAGFAKDELPSFAAFVLSVCDQDPQTQNAHWRPQTLNLSVDRIRYDFIGRLENFSQDWARLAGQTTLPAQSSFAGKRSSASRSEKLLFDSDMYAAVQHHYGDDFDRFGYDPAQPAPDPR
jgi:hypothetical protein